MSWFWRRFKVFRLLAQILAALQAILAEELKQTAEEIQQTELLRQIEKSTAPAPAVEFVPTVGSPIKK